MAHSSASDRDGYSEHSTAETNMTPIRIRVAGVRDEHTRNTALNQIAKTLRYLSEDVLYICSPRVF